MMGFKTWPSWLLLTTVCIATAKSPDDDYNVVHKDGSFQFGYDTPDSYHHADANRNNVVRGEFGGRNPATGAIDSTIYTAGPRGFRPRGKNVHRKYDLNQNGPRPVGSRDDPYYDPFEDPSYNFAFRTRTYSRQENANRVGDVQGKYTYLDDIGERHNVEFVAGKNTGFHVKTPFPDSSPRAYGPLYFTGRGKPIPRGRTSIQRGLDGSYRFVSAGPDQRRTETSDSTGHVRGSYTYLDDKGVQHSVHYIAGPETGYRVLKNVKGPHLPTVFPFGRPDIIPPDFYDYKDTGDVFDTAATGSDHVKPISGGSSSNNKPDKDQNPSFGGGIDVGKEDLDKLPSASGAGKPNRPSFADDGGDSDDYGDIFGGPSPARPSRPSTDDNTSRPSRPSTDDNIAPGDNDDGSYKPSDGDDGSYIPPGDVNQDDGQYKPGPDETPRPGLGSGSAPSRPAKPSIPDYDNDLNLFPSETNSRPPISNRPSTPVIHVQNGGAPGECEKCKGTIVTNVGDKLFSVPPGVSVRAHVQSIDLLPLVPKIPSPSEQFNEEMNIKTEQLNSGTAAVVGNATEESHQGLTTTTVAADTTTLVAETTTTASTNNTTL